MRQLLRLLPLLALAPLAFAQTTDLELQPIGYADTVPPGQMATVPIYLINNGPATATGAQLTITIPPGATYMSVNAPCTTPPVGQSGNVVCALPPLGPLPSPLGFIRVEVLVKVDLGTPPGVLSLPITLTCANATKPTQTATGSVNVLALAGVTIAMTSPSVVNGGSAYDNVVTVTNNGPGRAEVMGVHVTFDHSVAKSPAAPTGWSCTASDASASCTAPYLDPGSATFTFPATAPSSGSLTQTASVNAYNDANDQDNTAATTTAVAAPQPPPPTPVLRLTLASASDVVHPGDLVTYTAKIINTSSYTAGSVNLKWALPGPVIATTCGTPDNLSCIFPAIPAFTTQTVTRTIRVDASAGTELVASATVTAPDIVFNPLLDSATLSTTVVANPEPQPTRRRAVHH